jgi:predicted dehydrogenase
MTETLSGAIIGCGFFAKHHLEAWRRMPGIRIVAACDLDETRAMRFGDRAYRSAEEMLDREELDFVDIVTQPSSHLYLASLAAARGIAVICQKPIAQEWKSAVQLVNLMESNGVPFMVHENWRWQPWYRVARQMICDGDIGEPTNYGFRTRTKDGVGDEPYRLQAYFRELPRLLIYEALIHHLDTARLLFGDIQSVYADTARRNPNVIGEDCAIMIVNHVQDIRGWIDGNRLIDPNPDGPVMGEAFFEGSAGYLLIVGTGEVYLNNKPVWKNTVVAGYRGDSVYATQAHFISCLRTGSSFETGGREYLNSFAAMEAAYLSSAEHRLVHTSEFAENS